MKINPVFLPSDDEGRKPFCQICGLHHQLFGNIYRCPNCGANDAEQAKRVDRRILVADNPEPTIASKKSEKQKRDADLPPGAVWISDEEIT